MTLKITQFPRFRSQAACPPMWDGASCFPPTLAGQTAILPCMDNFGGTFYSPKCKLTNKNIKSKTKTIPCLDNLRGIFYSQKCKLTNKNTKTKKNCDPSCMDNFGFTLY